MRLSDYRSPPPQTKEYENLELSVTPKMNCKNHLIQVQIGQFTVDLSLNSATWLFISLQETLKDIDDAVGKRALDHLKNYTENG